MIKYYAFVKVVELKSINKAAEALGADINKCVVFEDSINGLLAGRASGAHVIGLTTTNTAEAIAPYCDETWPHF